MWGNYRKEKRSLSPLGLRVPIWKVKFLLYVFAAFKMEKEAANRHVLLRVVWEVQMSRNWCRCVFLVDFDISQMFAERVAQSATHFPDMTVYF